MGSTPRLQLKRVGEGKQNLCGTSASFKCNSTKFLDRNLYNWYTDKFLKFDFTFMTCLGKIFGS